jgi:hypothetical protein
MQSCSSDAKTVSEKWAERATRPFPNFQTGSKGLLGCLALALVLGIAANGFADQWDEDLLTAKIQNVNIQANSIEDACLKIGTKYLLRINFYKSVTGSNSASFSIEREQANGKELIDALLAIYPSYTYTQDPQTSIIWIHPKTIPYNEILNQKINVAHSMNQVLMTSSVYSPLIDLLYPTISVRPNIITLGSGNSMSYYVDLESGVHSVRQILNLCCVQNPAAAFEVEPGRVESSHCLIGIDYSYYPNPMSPPRPLAVKYFEIEVGKPTNDIPSTAEVSTALSDPSPRKRFAARNYYAMTQMNYSWVDLIAKSDGLEKKIWTALGITTAFLGNGSLPFAAISSGLTNDFVKIKDPQLALVLSLELARNKQDLPYLDSIVSQHKFTEPEIASIKPDVYRLAHESPLALDKLKALKVDVPEFSAKALRELADTTNVFTLVPAETK